MRTIPTAAVLLGLPISPGCNAGTSDNAASSGETAAPEAAAMATAPPATPPGTPEAKIANATSAAPAAISAQAAVMEMDSAGKMVELRPGTNGWLCVPDLPDTPGNDPMCADAAWQGWFTAYMSKTAPKPAGVGIAYMLQGGSDASNVDPYATAPAAGEGWIESGPHIMVLPTSTQMLDAFPTDPASGGPFVMWKGSPYAHLMVPVQGS